jgi:signal peptidase
MLISQALGVKPLVVLSGSMEPNYNVGGIVFVNTHADAADLEVGDVVTFQISGENVVTHRIVSLDETAQTFVTKGDANDSEDPPVPYGNLVGTAVFHIPLLGYVLINLGTTKALAVGLIVAAVVVALFVIPVLLKPSEPVGKHFKKVDSAN